MSENKIDYILCKNPVCEGEQTVAQFGVFVDLHNKLLRELEEKKFSQVHDEVDNHLKRVKKALPHMMGDS